ncbi:MAG TPA: DUF2252 domain-containing protein [Acidimicrobiia bacterium]|nr:DUF2252 domain-containing protein [Acidimicrobiia bacterium]
MTTTAARIDHPSLEERAVRGRQARKAVPRSSHTGWKPAAGRPDPVALLEEQNTFREPDLVPVRHGRMMVSPFTFYRGAARVMAADLEHTPRAGLDVQLCGDAHLSNFGVFASPERTLLFDLNDFDETLAGPFEYDVERLTASFVIAGRNNQYSTKEIRDAALASVAAYRNGMAEFAAMRNLGIWYSRMPAEQVLEVIRESATKKQAKQVKRAEETVDKARTHDSLQALSKLGEMVDGEYRIVSQPPIVVPARDVEALYGLDQGVVEELVHWQFREYRATLDPDRRHLLEQYREVDLARKVVGVGSVGTRAFIVLLLGRDDDDPLFLQIKEATASVLASHLPKSRYHNQGERVVQGQRMMQAASDIFLGWTTGLDANRFFYWRQLRDMKGSAVVETLTPAGLAVYARLCGWTLARAHARSGDSVGISSYLGSSDSFDRAIVDFAERYADQNERDYEEFVTAIRSGRLQAVERL